MENRKPMEKCRRSVLSSGKRWPYVGRLEMLMSVPMDIFFEIASHLTPLDLLHVARTSKQLRRILMSRKSRHVWINARRNMEPPLPDCPEDTSEPLYASLVFEPFCMNCGRRGLCVDYALKLRCCEVCWVDLTVPGKALVKLVLEDYIVDEFYNLLPADRHKLALKGPTSVNPKPESVKSVHQGAADRFSIVEFVDIAEHYRDVCNENDEVAFRTFIETRQTATLVRLNFHRAVVGWKYDKADYVKERMDRIRSERITTIQQRLQHLGFGPTDYPRLNEFNGYLDQSRKLTTGAWKRMLPELLQMLEWERESELRLKWKSRLSQLRIHYSILRQARDMAENPLPPFADAWELPCMVSLLTGSHSPLVTISAAQFAAIEPLIYAETEGFRKLVQDHLVTLFRGPHPELRPMSLSVQHMRQTAKKALLNMPIAVFHCAHCHLYLSYAGVFEHIYHAHDDTPWDEFSANIQAASSSSGCIEWDVSQLLRALRMPECTTSSELHTRLESWNNWICSCGPDQKGEGDLVESERGHRIFDSLLRHVASEPNLLHRINEYH